MRRSRSAKRGSERGGSLQLCVFRLGLLQDWDVGVGVFPKREEVLIGRPGFRGITGKNIGAVEAEMGQRADWEVLHYLPVRDDFLKLVLRGVALMRYSFASGLVFYC
jgi:hypothetical protein